MGFLAVIDPHLGGGGTSLHFSPPDGRSTRYDRQDFVALACRAQRTVQVRLRAPSGSRLFPPPGLRLVLTALSRTSPRRVVRHAGYRRKDQEMRFGGKVVLKQTRTHYAAETARGSRRFRLAWCAVNGNAKGDRAAPALADIVAGIPPYSHERFAGLDRPSTTTACCHKPL